MMEKPTEIADEIQSPCISICRMDVDNRFCTGCWRTREEIAIWGTASDQTRREILSLLHTRREAAGGRARRVTNRRRE
jgi:uncharacterized protein